MLWTIDENEMLELKKMKASGKNESPMLFDVYEYFHYCLEKYYMWIIKDCPC